MTWWGDGRKGSEYSPTEHHDTRPPTVTRKDTVLSGNYSVRVGTDMLLRLPGLLKTFCKYLSVEDTEDHVFSPVPSL